MNQLAFLDNKQMRDENIERLEVLNQVGELLSLPECEYSTAKQVSEFYGVSQDVIKNYIQGKSGLDGYCEELKSDGMISKTYDEVKREVSTLLNNSVINLKEYGVGVRGAVLFTKRSILRLGMILRNSEIAKELRTRLLDIVHDAGKTTTDNGNTIVENVVNEISEENKLMANIGIAICSGDMTKVIEAQTLYNNFKNNQLKQREEKIEVLESSAANIEDFKRQSNALIRSLSKAQGKTESEVWNNFYGYLEKKSGYKLRTRQQNKMLKLNNDRIANGKEPYKKSTLKSKVSILSTIKDTEYDSIIKILKGICSKEGIDVVSVLSFS